MTEAYGIRCGVCGAKNRIPASRAGQTARCGRCQSPVETRPLLAGAPIMAGDRDFEEQVLKSPLPVLVYFWAPWCPTCKTAMPMIGELAREFKGRFRVVKLNVDQAPVTASKYQVMSVPTLIIFDKGRSVETFSGGMPKAVVAGKMAGHVYRV